MISLKIFVGLGNPGEKYNNTYHNIGFMFCNTIAQKFNFPKPIFKEKLSGFYSGKEINNQKIILLWPTTFMNLSGESVSKIINETNINLKNLFVIHDDLAFPFGVQKIKFSGSSAGHNGIESIIKTLESKKFYRIRLGIKDVNINNLEM